MATQEQIDAVKNALRQQFKGEVRTTSDPDNPDQHFEIRELGNTFAVLVHQDLFEAITVPEKLASHLTVLQIAEQLRAAGTESLAIIKGIGRVEIQKTPNLRRNKREG